MKNIFIIFINENLKVFIFENFESKILRLTPLWKKFSYSRENWIIIINKYITNNAEYNVIIYFGITLIYT